jgi:hypothetical protein
VPSPPTGSRSVKDSVSQGRQSWHQRPHLFCSHSPHQSAALSRSRRCLESRLAGVRPSPQPRHPELRVSSCTGHRPGQIQPLKDWLPGLRTATARCHGHGASLPRRAREMERGWRRATAPARVCRSRLAEAPSQRSTAAGSRYSSRSVKCVDECGAVRQRGLSSEVCKSRSRPAARRRPAHRSMTSQHTVRSIVTPLIRKLLAVAGGWRWSTRMPTMSPQSRQESSIQAWRGTVARRHHRDLALTSESEAQHRSMRGAGSDPGLYSLGGRVPTS